MTIFTSGGIPTSRVNFKYWESMSSPVDGVMVMVKAEVKSLKNIIELQLCPLFYKSIIVISANNSTCIRTPSIASATTKNNKNTFKARP